MSELNNKVIRATKWSAMTEIAVKLVSPITNMVLARLLTPEAFGVVATLTMIIAFAELFTDAGFHKYLVQHEFCDYEDREQSTNVAFWSNFILSMFLWGIIALFSSPLATLVGNDGLGHVLIVACVSIPLAAFSSIQKALFRRDLDFKTLFKVRITSIFMPILVTIPLAIWLHNYWALVFGTISRNIVNAIILTVMSKWKPRFYYSFAKLKEMLSFTIWTLIESVSIWLTIYIDVFIVGTMLNQHYLGLYKTGSALVGQMIGLVVATTTPILFSSLSRLQDNDIEFNALFLKFQKYVGLIVLPIGVIFFCYSDLITTVLLGKQWLESSEFVGLWGLTSSIGAVLSFNCSEVYRAKGKPKLSVLAQWLHIIFLWPVVYISVQYGFKTLCVSRSLIRLEMYLVNIVIIYFLIKITPLQMYRNISNSLNFSVIMGIAAFLMTRLSHSIIWQIISLLLCCILYLALLLHSSDSPIIIHYLRKAKLFILKK